MADVRFLCVYQDVDRAEQLAETFEASGLSIASGADEEAGVTILLWSESAAQSRSFLRAASAACPDTTLIASLMPGVTHPNVFDLSAGDSSKERALVRAAHKLTSHADAEETSALPLAPEPVAEPVIAQAPRHPTTSGWRDVDPQPPYRRIGAALALGFIAFLGVQLPPAPAPQAMSVAEAPILIADATAYEPAAASIDVVFESQADPVAPPQGLLEPASAGDRTPPPYRSWDHEAPAEAAPVETAAIASTGFEASFKSATLATTRDIEAESGWQTASFRLP